VKGKDEGGRMKDESVMIRLEQFFFHPSAFILHPFRSPFGNRTASR
jgi:hypothetical protein